MSKVYILNTHIEFSPEKCQLTARNSDNLVITLNKPVSRCLELLIERRFSVVPQRDFYSYVWGDEGGAVSVMMLYQCIALLRKALKAFKTSAGERMINTVPKKGFILDASVTVQEEMDGVVVLSPCAQVVETDRVLPENNILPSMPTITPKKVISQRGAEKSVLLILGLLLLGILIYQFSEKDTTKTQQYLTRFHEMGQVAGCHVYAYDDLLGVASIKSIIADSGIDCKERPYIYITHFQYSQQFSLLSCDTLLSGVVAPSCTAINVFRNAK